MQTIARCLGILSIPFLLHAHEGITLDSQRGAEVFQSLPCVRCHSINGTGGTRGPDLAKRLKREYSPAGLAARMWNHAPAMWSAMSEDGINFEPIGKEPVADLFAYFYSLRYLDHRTDADRGRKLFERERCSGCHALDHSTRSTAKPVSDWSSLNRPLVFSAAIWTHAVNMEDTFQAAGVKRPQLKGNELADIIGYLRNLPQMAKAPVVLDTQAAEETEFLEAKGCTGCHRARFELPRRIRTKMVNDVAASMWNHASNHQSLSLTGGDMGKIVDLLWSQQVLEPAGDIETGRELFGQRCAACHSGTGVAPALVDRKGKVSVVSIVSSLWTHGPQMLARLKQNNMQWPTFTTDEMADVITFLNSGGR